MTSLFLLAGMTVLVVCRSHDWCFKTFTAVFSDIEVLYNFQQQVAIIQRDAIWWMHTVVPKFAEPKASDYVSWLVL